MYKSTNNENLCKLNAGFEPKKLISEAQVQASHLSRTYVRIIGRVSRKLALLEDPWKKRVIFLTSIKQKC